MLKRSLVIIIMLLSSIMSFAQTDSSHIRLSLLTCGVGEELYSSFGHTGVRVIDSNKGIDIVFNYGTFSFSDPDFYMKFTRGKLLYYVSIDTYPSFMQEYVYEHRSVEEQVFILPGDKKQQIYAFLQHNALPENREYKYDFLFDNCATRIRDIFPRTLGEGFHYGHTLPQGAKISFRNIIDHYLAREHWERFGIDIALGSKVDKIMTEMDVMFLPDYIRDGLVNASLNGRKVVAPTEVLLQAAPVPPADLNQPLMLCLGILILTVAGLTMPKLRLLGKIMTGLLLFVSGLLGCFLLFMWLGTDHQACTDNLNILWALPTNLILLFAPKKSKGRYAVIAIMLIFVSLLLHILKIQLLPLYELWPLLLALLFVYGSLYRRSVPKTAA